MKPSYAIIKAIEWRVWAFLLDGVIVLVITNDIKLAFGVAFWTTIIKTIAHAIWMWLRDNNKQL